MEQFIVFNYLHVIPSTHPNGLSGNPKSISIRTFSFPLQGHMMQQSLGVLFGVGYGERASTSHLETLAAAQMPKRSLLLLCHSWGM